MRRGSALRENLLMKEDFKQSGGARHLYMNDGTARAGRSRRKSPPPGLGCPGDDTNRDDLS